MDIIGEIKGNLYLRHYSQDTFKEFKELKNIDSLEIITYLSVSSLRSTLNFIMENFASKSQKVTIIFGISGLEYEGSEEKFNEFVDDLKKLNNPSLQIYLHSRCHIKAIRADELLYLGTQNVSSTSNMFIENVKKAKNSKKGSWDSVFNYHELVFRVDSASSREYSSKLIDLLLEDKISSHKIYNGALNSIDFALIKKQFDYNEIIEAHKAIRPYLKELLDTSASLFNLNLNYEEPDFTPENSADSLGLLISISNETDLDSAKDDIEDILELTFGGDDLSQLKYDETDLFELHDGIDFLSQVCDSGGLPEALSNSITGSLEEIQTRIDDLESPSIFSLCQEDKNELFRKIINEIHAAGATDIESFVERNMHDISDYLTGSPGEYFDSLYTDEDGNLIDDAVEIAIRNKDLSKSTLIYAARDKLGDLMRVIANLMYSCIKDEMDTQIAEIESIIEDIEYNKEQLVPNAIAYSKLGVT